MSDTSTTATIRKLLIANRGEIASRIMRTARAMGIATVAVFSDADEDAPFVADADEAVRLPGNTPAETYLRSDLVVEAARRTGADAVHPGYGFLSENAEFARACGDAGLVFVGPSPRAIELMGSKLEAKRIMTEVGVPVLPTAVVDGAMTAAELAAAGESIGFPVLVKAAFGGGGRGMRVVEVPGDLAEAVGAAQREAAAAFGDGTTFLEPYLRAPRHVEVQILGDTHGTVTHLFERECSIQRRHQKIVEESPSPAVDDALRAEMCEAALGAGKAIGYVGAGTVEFVLDAQGRFFFLEVNTRLQVEHPVTEMITGLDLVELQLRVAQGEALPIEVLDATMSGHAIEARLYAEDVAAGFLPVSGTIDRLRVPAGDAVRIDTGYDDGSVVSPFYDSMLAKVIAWAPTRTVAALRLAPRARGCAAARRRDQPQPARRGAARPRVPRRCDRHRLPRPARPRRAQQPCAERRHRAPPRGRRTPGRPRGAPFVVTPSGRDPGGVAQRRAGRPARPAQDRSSCARAVVAGAA